MRNNGKYIFLLDDRENQCRPWNYDDDIKVKWFKTLCNSCQCHSVAPKHDRKTTPPSHLYFSTFIVPTVCDHKLRRTQISRQQRYQYNVRLVEKALRVETVLFIVHLSKPANGMEYGAVVKGPNASKQLHNEHNTNAKPYILILSF